MPKRRPRAKDFSDLLDDRDVPSHAADDRADPRQAFTKRAKFHQHNKTLRTADMRLADASLSAEKKDLPAGRVVQVFSLYAEVEPLAGGDRLLATARRTLRKVISLELGEIVVGDEVRYRVTGGTVAMPGTNDPPRPEGVIEAVLPRRTVLTRQDSFEAHRIDPIVANADTFLIVASTHAPFPRWGLIDRMLVAARTGGLSPAVVMNKADLLHLADDPDAIAANLAHYASMNVPTLLTSVETGQGLAELDRLLVGRVTVLAGHSGVGKSSLVRAVRPHLDLRVGEVSDVHEKGKHTTTSARRYPLNPEETGEAAVIDTPGVKQFGLWNVTPDDLEQYFPDVTAGNAPPWRVESFERIRESLGSQ